VAEYLDRINHIDAASLGKGGLIEAFPVLKSHIQRVNSLPGIAERVAQRPKDWLF